MRQTIYTPIAILALNTGDIDKERSIIKACGFGAMAAVEGVYKGEKELAWLVPFSEPGQKQALLRLARDYYQESVLFQEMSGEVFLHFPDTGEEEHLGRLVEVPEDIAKKQDSYTRLPLAANGRGVYYITRK